MYKEDLTLNGLKFHKKSHKTTKSNIIYIYKEDWALNIRNSCYVIYIYIEKLNRESGLSYNSFA